VVEGVVSETVPAIEGRFAVMGQVKKPGAYRLSIIRLMMLGR